MREEFPAMKQKQDAIDKVKKSQKKKPLKQIRKLE